MKKVDKIKKYRGEITGLNMIKGICKRIIFPRFEISKQNKKTIIVVLDEIIFAVSQKIKG